MSLGPVSYWLRGILSQGYKEYMYMCVCIYILYVRVCVCVYIYIYIQPPSFQAHMITSKSPKALCVPPIFSDVLNKIMQLRQKTLAL